MGLAAVRLCAQRNQGQQRKRQPRDAFQESRLKRPAPHASIIRQVVVAAIAGNQLSDRRDRSVSTSSDS